MTWQDLVVIRFTDQWSLSVQVGVAVIVLGVFGLIAYILYRFWWRGKMPHWAVVEAEIPFGGLGKVTIRPSYDDIQIAHKAWVELTTRKAGLPFDEQHDVITEIYDSWYELFGEIRTLVKQIPAEKIRNSKDTQQIVVLLVDALNAGLRPHLTRWQARFRRWYESELQKHPDKTPQEIQKLYPQHNDLITDLKSVNQRLMKYTAFVKSIAQGKTTP